MISSVTRGALTLLVTALTGVAGAATTTQPRQARPLPPGNAPTPRAVAVAYAAPVPGQVTRGFEPPRTRYSAGHRGVDLATVPGQTVRADGAGTVTFAGPVAGRGVLVITHPDGVRTEVEPVRPLVKAGTKVVLGKAIATVDGRHAGCATSRCLHWGARRGEAYFDPLTLLAPLGPVRLLPWVG